MKRHILLAVGFALVASPSVAQTQFEKAVGVPGGTLTTAELIQLRNAMEQDNRDASAIKVRRLHDRAAVQVTRN